MAVVDYFLKIDGIDGDSQDAKHKGEIQLLSFHLGVVDTGVQGDTGGGHVGRPREIPLTAVKLVDSASPKLFTATEGGRHIQKAVLACRKAGGEQQEFLKIVLTDVLVSSDRFDANNGEFPTEEFSLHFGAIDIQFINQTNPAGT